MKNLPLFVLTLCALLTTSVAHAQQSDGPFGLSMGMKRAEVEKLLGKFKETEPGMLVSPQVPKPHPDFESYGVVVAPTYGVCKIIAIGKNIQMNSFGDQVKTAFSTLLEAISEKYGKPQVFDFLKAGSIWKDPDDWAMGFAQEERTLAAMWEAHGILLRAKALNSSVGYINLSYESKDVEACLKEATQAKRSVF